MARRKSIDSSDSDSGSDKSGSDSGKAYQKKDKKDKKDKDKDKSKDKDHKDKKDKDEKKDKKDKDEKKDKGVHGGQHSGGHPSTAEVDYKQARFHSSQILDIDQPQTLPSNSNFGAHPASPQPHSSASSAPPSGYRVPLTTESPFPDAQQTGLPVASDSDGSPLFIGSALFDRSVQPCKIGPHLQPYVSVAYGGQEYSHHGRYDLLPFDKNTMEWVPTTSGRIPPGKRPIEGGYEESGAKLYHALANVRGLWVVPGKTGEHLGAAHVSFGGSEVPVTEYSILCFR